MTVTTTYICDRCGKSQLERIVTSMPPLYRVELRCVPIDDRNRDTYISPRREAEWCGACLAECGIDHPVLLRGDASQEKVSFEDLIRQIVRKEIEGE